MNFGIKFTALALAALALACAFLFFTNLRDRIGVPLLLLAAVVLMDGISTLYAVSGKFALYEFLKVLASFCLALVLLALAPREGGERQIATILAGYSALSGLVSIDLMSTRLFSGMVLGLLAQFTPDYANQIGVEAGTRMYGMYGNPNVFAGVAGLGVLLSLGLVCSAKGKTERTVQTAILYVNALSFLLAFSMGATAAIALAFLALLALTPKQGRMGLLVLMVETLVLTVLAAGVISVTSFGPWTGIRPVPLLCTALGAAALCQLDRLMGQKLAGKLGGKGKLVPVVTAAVLAVLVVFGLAAYHLTGPVTLEAGGTLRRAAYPEAGTYTLSVDADGPLTVTVESQNQQETMTHTNTVLYSGDAAKASFTVPEDSLVVYFNFSAPEGAHIQNASCGSEPIPLNYKLLPGFIANRLQGLWANQNAIQRLVFFDDGLKLFRRSPVVGLGLGAFENGIKGVQTFYYETKYAHNHYIQSLAETGVIGLALFLLLLGGSAAAVLLDRKKGDAVHPLTPALGAALVFMAGHAATEVVFSSYPYLPIAFGVFALISLCCGESLPVKLGKAAKTTALLVLCALVGAYAILLVGNMRARAVAEADDSFEAIDEAVSLDKFEWADHALTYVDRALDPGLDDSIRSRADEYARRLAKLDSNTIPIHLAVYYFETDRTEEALAMVEKYVAYVSSDAAAWQEAFDTLLKYKEDSEVYRTGVQKIAQMLADWNEANLGEIEVNEAAKALIAEVNG